MKKRLITGLCLVALLLSGCSSEANKEEAFVNSSKLYYNEYMSGLVGVDSATITLEMLLNSPSKDSYELKDIEECTKTSFVIFELTDGEITNTQVELICK